MRTWKTLTTVLLLCACGDATAPGTAGPLLSAAGHPAAGDVIANYQEYTVTLNGMVAACIGEPVEVTFRYAERLHIVTDATDGFHGVHTVVDKGSTAVGVNSGTHFMVQEGLQEHFQQKVAGFPADLTASFDRRFVSRGSGLAFRIHNLAHFTIDANGVETVNFSDTEVFCQ